MKVSVCKCKANGKPSWRLRYRENGIVRRKFFTAKSDAEAHASKLRAESPDVNGWWGLLDGPQRERVFTVWREADRRGLDLLHLLAMAGEGEKSASPTLRTVIDEIVLAKQKAGRAHEYVTSLKNILDKFARGKESRAINRVTFLELQAFIDGHTINYRSTLRSRISTFFKFAIRQGYCVANPCDRLEGITLRRPPPRIMTVDELGACLKWLKANPRALGWFALSALAGLRPEEAQKTTWAMINFKEQWVRVESQTTKVNERRVVYPREEAMQWLQRAKRLKATLPLASKALIKARVRLRAILGLERWPHDFTRHTAASYWFPVSGAKHVSEMLGHSEKILHSRYKALVTKAEAAKFWRAVSGKVPVPIMKER